MKYKALKTNVIGVEPGKTVFSKKNSGNVLVDSDCLSCIDSADSTKDTIIISLESGQSATLSEHAIGKNNARTLMLDLIGALVAVGDPLATLLRDRLPTSQEELEPYFS